MNDAKEVKNLVKAAKEVLKNAGIHLIQTEVLASMRTQNFWQLADGETPEEFLAACCNDDCDYIHGKTRVHLGVTNNGDGKFTVNLGEFPGDGSGFGYCNLWTGTDPENLAMWIKGKLQACRDENNPTSSKP